MSMYDRYAADASESLFNSIYGELNKIAEAEQVGIYTSKKKRDKMYIGEAQETFNSFCHGRLSIGDALDFIRIRKAFSQPS